MGEPNEVSRHVECYDQMIEAEAESEHAKDVHELDSLRAELNALKDTGQKESR